MKAIILAGGLATRLRPLTLHQPKALMPLLDRPFISYQFDLLVAAGVTEVVMAAGYLADVLKKNCPRDTSLKIYFSVEDSPLGTGGAIRLAYEQFPSKEPTSILVFNGDVLFDIDVKTYFAFHKQNKAQGSIALKKVDDPVRFGVVDIDASCRVQAFLEKPHGRTGEAFINAGAYILESTIIEAIPLGKLLSVEREVFPKLLSDNTPLFGYACNGYWNDIGTHESYAQAQKDLLTVKNVWTEKILLRKRGPFL